MAQAAQGTGCPGLSILVPRGTAGQCRSMVEDMGGINLPTSISSSKRVSGGRRTYCKACLGSVQCCHPEALLGTEIPQEEGWGQLHPPCEPPITLSPPRPLFQTSPTTPARRTAA